MNIEEQVTKYVPEVKKQCDILVVLANARDNEIEKIAASNPSIDVILGGRTFNFSEHDRPTKLGNTLIHKNGGIGKYIGRLRLDLQPATPVKIKNYEGFNVKLGDDIVDDPEITFQVQGINVDSSTWRFIIPLEDTSTFKQGNMHTQFWLEDANESITYIASQWPIVKTARNA